MSIDDIAKEMATLKAEVVTLFKNDDRFERCVEDIRTDIKQLANRLPNWATVLIGLLMAACGWFAAK